MKKYEEFETERLFIRPVRVEDAPQIQEQFAKWEIIENLNAGNVPWPYPNDGAYKFVTEFALPKMEEGAIITWSIFLKGEGMPLIGIINLRLAEEENRGFWIGTPFQNQGYITEACVVINDYWFFTLNRPRMVLSKAIDNLASNRVSEKQKMRKIGQIMKDYVGGKKLANLWELTKEEWQSRLE